MSQSDVTDKMAAMVNVLVSTLTINMELNGSVSNNNLLLK